MVATIQRINDNYIVRFPASIIENLKIKENEVMQVFEEYGRIIIQKPYMTTLANDTTRTTINELFEDYNDEYESIPIDWGTPVGKEIW